MNESDPKYPVTEIFYSLQGEGHFVGYPMTFVRLAGCSVLDCGIRARCDEAPWPTKMRRYAAEIVDSIRRGQTAVPSATARPRPPFGPGGIVCLTGGEPADHDLVPLVSLLRDEGYRVHIETSGTRSLDGIPFDWITVSPKVSNYKQRAGHTLKVVVRPEWGSPEKAWDYVLGISDCTDFFHRYLQPLSGPDGRPVNLPEVVEMLMGGYHNAGGRWALSTQAHKNWSIR